MRIGIVVVTAGLVTAGAGWFWLAPDDVAEHAAPPARARTADLTNLHTQLAAARHVPADERPPLAAPAPVRDADLTEVAAEVAATDVLSFDAIDDGRFDELLALPAEQRDAAFAEALGRQLTIDDRLLLGIEDVEEPEPDVLGDGDIDVLADGDMVGHEIVRIEGSPPIIDVTVSGCSGVQVDYVVAIPVPPRTFESALGDAAGEHAGDGAVTFSGGTPLENVYIVEESD